MNAVRDALWEQIRLAVFITREQWERELEGWTIEPVERDGALAFVVLTRGPELHFTSFGNAPISLRMIRERVQPLIDQYGYVETKTPKDATRQRRFNEMIGFVVDSESEFFLHYRAEKLRSHRCPS